MARSEEQKKDLKFKLYAALTIAIIAAPILALGPLLPRILKSYETKPTHPDSPKRMLMCIQIEANTMRAESARKNLEKWITLFVEEDSRDWEAVMSGTAEFTMMKYDMNNGLLEQGFTPWLFPEGRPAPVAKANDALVAEALDLYGTLLEDTKEYPRAAHIFICLANMFPQDSVGQLAGEDGYKRCAVRSY